MIFRGKSWKKRILLDLSIIGFVVGLAFAKILYNWAVPLGDFDTVHPVPPLNTSTLPISPEKQIETHTCGLHAVSAIYRSYGLDSTERRLRQRLGIDNKSFAYDSSTTGCLHPDVYRVMTQDGFICQNLNLSKLDSKELLKRHLDENRYALALIKRQENGHLHWIVISGRKDNALFICDSLNPDIYSEDLDAYWKKCLLSVILISPATAKQETAIWRLHMRGLIDMYEAFHHR